MMVSKWVDGFERARFHFLKQRLVPFGDLCTSDMLELDRRDHSLDVSRCAN